MTEELIAMWRQAKLDTGSNGNAALEAFAGMVAEDCAATSPNGCNVGMGDAPHIVWLKFGSAIRTKYALK